MWEHVARKQNTWNQAQLKNYINGAEKIKSFWGYCYLNFAGFKCITE